MTVRSLLTVLAALLATLALPTPVPAAGTPLSRARVSVTQTSADLTQALSPQASRRFSPARARGGLPVIHVDDSVSYQRFLGAGAAMTDSSAWLLEDGLPAATRTSLMSRLFGTAGIHLSFLRLPMGASDFTRDGTAYTYDDLPPGQTDPTLADFSIAHDEAYILPALRQARALDPKLYLEALPWSPPAWMKTNRALDNTNRAGRLLGSAYGPYARYFVKFLRAYAAAGVRVSAVAVQDEPTEYTIGPGLELSQAQETQFVARDLRPALSAARVSDSVFGWDLSWGPLTGSDPLVRATLPTGPTTTSSRRAPGPLTGLAWHCYFGSPKVMDRVHRVSPASVQILDECGTGAHDSWATPELLIASLRHWAAGIAFWNVALDPTGGPVTQPNIGCVACTGVVTIDPQTGGYTLTPDFYALGQLTRFVSPGAVRIASSSFATYSLNRHYQTKVSRGLDDVALKNPDGSKVLLAYNNARTPITFQVQYHGSTITYTIPAGAATTFVWR